MAAREAAGIFSDIFCLLAADAVNPLLRQYVEKLSRAVWSKTFWYDFSSCQMECNEELKILGLAVMGVDPVYPEDGEVWIYADKTGVLPEALGSKW